VVDAVADQGGPDTNVSCEEQLFLLFFWCATFGYLQFSLIFVNEPGLDTFINLAWL